MKNTKLPLVYSCSGCSSAAQMANWIALKLDREEIAEMSCIAGLGGHVKPLIKKAKEASSIIGIDGCPLQCVTHCLEQHQLKSEKHFELSQFQVEKKAHDDFDPKQAEEVYQQIRQALQKQES